MEAFKDNKNIFPCIFSCFEQAGKCGHLVYHIARSRYLSLNPTVSTASSADRASSSSKPQHNVTKLGACHWTQQAPPQQLGAQWSLGFFFTGDSELTSWTVWQASCSPSPPRALYFTIPCPCGSSLFALLLRKWTTQWLSPSTLFGSQWNTFSWAWGEQSSFFWTVGNSQSGIVYLDTHVIITHSVETSMLKYNWCFKL